MISCDTLFGKKKFVEKDKLIFRPGAYALIVHEGKVLIINTHSTGKYFFPGGGVNLGERIEDALVREVREETGLEVEVKKYLHFKESFFYYDPYDMAFQSYSFFFICSPKTFGLSDKGQIRDEEAENPRWVDIETLDEKNIQSFGEVVSLLKSTDLKSI